MLILCIFLYLTGCLLGYRLYKRYTVREFREWTIGDRREGLFLSLMSWATVLAAFIIQGLGEKEGDNKPAKW